MRAAVSRLALALTLGWLVCARDAGTGTPPAARAVARARTATGLLHASARVERTDELAVPLFGRASPAGPFWTVRLSAPVGGTLALDGLEVTLVEDGPIVAVRSLPLAPWSDQARRGWTAPSPGEDVAMWPADPVVPLAAAISDLEHQPSGGARPRSIEAFLVPEVDPSGTVRDLWSVRLRGGALTVCPPPRREGPSDGCSRHLTAWIATTDARSGEPLLRWSAPDG